MTSHRLSCVGWKARPAVQSSIWIQLDTVIISNSNSCNAIECISAVNRNNRCMGDYFSNILLLIIRSDRRYDRLSTVASDTIRRDASLFWDRTNKNSGVLCLSTTMRSTRNFHSESSKRIVFTLLHFLQKSQGMLDRRSIRLLDKTVRS